jgi:hypothetical protein
MDPTHTKHDTVDSLLFVGYKFSWISWEQANHEFKYQTYCNFSVDLLLKKWRNHLTILELIQFAKKISNFDFRKLKNGILKKKTDYCGFIYFRGYQFSWM